MENLGRNGDSGLRIVHIYIPYMDRMGYVCYKLHRVVSHECIYKYVASNSKRGPRLEIYGLINPYFILSCTFYRIHHLYISFVPRPTAGTML